MKLSIVIPTKNEEVLLPRLLHSIQEQSFRDYEVIVADAGSTDQTRNLAQQFGAKVVDGGMPGPGRNRGAEHAQGEVIVFFDADIMLPHPDFLYDCLQEMDRRQFDMTTCRILAYEGTIRDHAMHGAYNVYTLATEHILPHAPGFCLFARREVHQTIKGFDEEVIFAEDHDYVRRAKKAGYHFGILLKHKIPVSVRRMEKEGRMKLMMKYAFTELYMLTRGPFKKRMPFRYEWAKFAPKDDDRG